MWHTSPAQASSHSQSFTKTPFAEVMEESQFSMTQAPSNAMMWPPSCSRDLCKASFRVMEDKLLAIGEMAPNRWNLHIIAIFHWRIFSHRFWGFILVVRVSICRAKVRLFAARPLAIRLERQTQSLKFFGPKTFGALGTPPVAKTVAHTAVTWARITWARWQMVVSSWWVFFVCSAFWCLLNKNNSLVLNEIRWTQKKNTCFSDHYQNSFFGGFSIRPPQWPNEPRSLRASSDPRDWWPAAATHRDANEPRQPISATPLGGAPNTLAPRKDLFWFQGNFECIERILSIFIYI